MDLSLDQLEALAAAKSRRRARETLRLAQGIAAREDRQLWRQWQQGLIRESQPPA